MVSQLRQQQPVGIKSLSKPINAGAPCRRATGDVDAGPESVRAATNQLDTAYRVLMDGLRQGFEPSQIHDDGVGIVQVTSETGTMSTFFEYIREIAVLIVSLMDNCSIGMTILDTFMTEPQSLSGLNKSTSLIRVCFLREQSIEISVLYVKKI